jgi:divalent metal cation (Fe/Co/Zn/Cd) transporter
VNDSPSTRAHLRAGMRLSWVSASWTIVASSAAIVVGLFDHSLVLLVFGLTGFLDAAGSVTLALHFSHALRHEAISRTRERFALRVVSGGLIAIGVSTLVESVRRLLDNSTVHGSPFGIALASVSAVVLAALTFRKRSVAARLRSEALRADAWLSAAGAVLAVVTITGTVLVALSGPSWVDPISALVVAVLAAGMGIAALRREQQGL